MIYEIWNNMTHYTVAVVGLGKIGLKYDLNALNEWIPNQVMTHCRALRDSEYFEIIYLVDEDLKVLHLASEIYPDTLCVSFKDALNLKAPDIVIIATPTSTHFTVAAATLAAWNSKYYIIEKPFGADSIEAFLMYELFQEQNTHVFINYFRRFLQNVREIHDSKHFLNRGKLLKVVGNGYGTLKNIFSHFLDIIIFLEGRNSLGLEPKKVIKSNNGVLTFLDGAAKTTYEFYGIGNPKQDCTFELHYEQITIFFNLNGQQIEITNCDGDVLDCIDLGKQRFDSYQAEVLSQILNKMSSQPDATAMLDAIHLHKFIETVDLLHDA